MDPGIGDVFREEAAAIMFGEGLNLRNFALMGLSTGVDKSLDANLFKENTKVAVILVTTGNGRKIKAFMNAWFVSSKKNECLICIHIEIACSAEMQREQMIIAEVVAQFCYIKNRLAGI